MTTYNTGKPVGSSDPRDLYDNAENLDVLVNSPDKLAHDDRLGVSRKTWHGMEKAFQEFLLKSGYEDIGDYAAGLEITARNQIFLREGEYYKPSASLALPYVTSGDWATEVGSFVSVGDAVLRQELASDGGELIGVDSSTGAQQLGAALNQREMWTDSLLGLKGVSLSGLVADQSARITTGVRAGSFTWKAGDQSANVAADPQEGVWVAPSSELSGASGAWERKYDWLLPSFFGAYTGAPNNYSALQAYLNYCVFTESAIHLPKAGYRYSTGLVINAPGAAVDIVGESKFKSSLIFSGDGENALDITAGNFSGKDFSVLYAGGVMTSGGAIRIKADRPTLTRVLVNSVTGSDRWANFFVSLSGNETVVDSCSLLGTVPNQDNLHGIVYDSGTKSVSHDVKSTIIYNCDRSYYIRSISAPGAEGFRISGGEAVGCNVGVDARNTAGYTPPMLSLTSTHINCAAQCVFGVGYQNINVQGGLFYSAGSSFFYIEDTVDFRCQGLTMADQGGPANQTAFTYVGNVAVIDTSGNYYQGSSSSSTWAFYQPEGNISYVSVVNNKMNAGGWNTARDVWVGGEQPSSYIHSDNYPKVGEDIRQFANLSGGTVDIRGTRAERILVSGVTGTSSIDSLLGTNDGRVVILQCDVAGVTVVHGPNLRLFNNFNYTYEAGSKLWLVNNLDGSWEEVSRSG